MSLIRLAVLLVWLALIAGCHVLKSVPEGISYAGHSAPASDLAFLTDSTWVDPAGQRQVDQQIFDELFSIIGAAERLIVLDMFLYNDFQGAIPETTRALAGELTQALLARKQAVPDIEIVVISDPVNTVYGGLPSPYFAQLRQAGIRVVITDLRQLRDSNPVYSMLWRALIKPWGNRPAQTLPNPIGPGRVSLRSYLELINFKANHRKVLIADQGDDYVGFVSSANPHDGSSAHRNVAVRFNGGAVADLLVSENAVLAFSGQPQVSHTLQDSPSAQVTRTEVPTVQVLTEGKIKQAVLSLLASVTAADQVDLMMFYLSDRQVIQALKQARQRGVQLRLLLDPNKDAFGREKNGIPNRPVARELVKADLAVRWCDTHGEQCHSKLMMVRHGDGWADIVTGSANFTRRNLNDFNLETNVQVRAPTASAPVTKVLDYFESAWGNTDGRQMSVEYELYANDTWWHRRLYRFMEWSGLSTF